MPCVWHRVTISTRDRTQYVNSAMVATVAKRGRPKNPTGEGTPVRIDSDLVKKARYLAIDKDQPVSEVLSDLLRPVIEREYRKWEKEHLKGDDATKGK